MISTPADNSGRGFLVHVFNTPTSWAQSEIARQFKVFGTVVRVYQEIGQKISSYFSTLLTFYCLNYFGDK